MPRTEIYTFFTKPGETRLLYSAEEWVECILELQTAGPVSYSTREEVVPVLSGKGILLTTGERERFTLSKGDRLFIGAEAVNRLAFTVQPFAYGRQIIDNQAAQIELQAQLQGLPTPAVIPTTREANPPKKRGDVHETIPRQAPVLSYGGSKIPHFRGNK
jgi:hypothetical protein